MMIALLTDWKLAGITACVVLGFLLYVVLINGFLAVTDPVKASVLVVESWFWSRPAMREAAAEFKNGGYDCVICVGGQEAQKRGVNQPSNSELAADRLVELGVERQYVHAVALPATEREYTIGSARAVHEWLHRERPGTKAVNVFTLGVHARKSQLLFKKVLGHEVGVGIISGAEDAYNVSWWWASPAGIYLVFRNTVGYLYALVLAASPDVFIRD